VVYTQWVEGVISMPKTLLQVIASLKDSESREAKEHALDVAAKELFAVYNEQEEQRGLTEVRDKIELLGEELKGIDRPNFDKLNEIYTYANNKLENIAKNYELLDEDEQEAISESAGFLQILHAAVHISYLEVVRLEHEQEIAEKSNRGKSSQVGMMKSKLAPSLSEGDSSDPVTKPKNVGLRGH
jgi:hypothetical protein